MEEWEIYCTNEECANYNDRDAVTCEACCSDKGSKYYDTL
jgi:hypothetical protein